MLFRTHLRFSLKDLCWYFYLAFRKHTEQTLASCRRHNHPEWNDLPIVSQVWYIIGVTLFIVANKGKYP